MKKINKFEKNQPAKQQVKLKVINIPSNPLNMK